MRREWNRVEGRLMPAMKGPGDSKIWMPSRKKGRRSRRKVSKTPRLSTAGSPSTWPKSGLTVALREMFDDRP